MTEFEQYVDLLDTTYDEKFSAVPNLRWTPWVGKTFQKKTSHKLLIVGESHYAKANPTMILPQRAKNTKTGAEKQVFLCDTIVQSLAFWGRFLPRTRGFDTVGRDLSSRDSIEMGFDSTAIEIRFSCSEYVLSNAALIVIGVRGG